MISVKKISKTGSVTIPAPLRRKLGIIAGDTFEIEESDDGIVFKRSYGHCIFCGTNIGIKYFNKICVCEGCSKKVREMF
ncbi:AbrB/MazE/SpoVT family DNA-binding domain-containing protein [[Clostridium] colinum]|uniref:AbrB/MazE/SpoVT family DNA-binding domain-containing protein n=1 Tax=[Clostridium] colinum TaxID=36835 RepID=UPI00202441B8|nr:AbrB/MazE/SpoVT family DNA-binding domain-containing protein [[Clostridium] colinum]